jgi:hypothetical protein
MEPSDHLDTVVQGHASKSVLAQGTLQKLQNLLRNPYQPTIRKMWLNNSICLSFVYITSKISVSNLKLIDNLIALSDTSTVYGEQRWLTWLQNQEVSGLKQRLIIWVQSVTEWLVSKVATRNVIRTYKFRKANKTLPPLRIFVSWNLWHPFAETNSRN